MIDRTSRKSNKRPDLRYLEYDHGNPLDGARFSDDPLDALNDLVRETGKAVARARSKPSVQNTNVRRQRQDSKAWSDAKFYTVLVFDTGDQCQAFIDFIEVKAHLSDGGDLFIDGRAIADTLGCELPPPEYHLKPQKVGVTKPMTKGLARRSADADT